METPPNLPIPTPAVTPYYANPLDILRDRSETTARTLCIVLGAIGFIVSFCTFVIGMTILSSALIGWIMSFWLAARLKAGAVLVTQKSWPELFAITEDAKGKLGAQDLKVYVAQDSMFNAFATRWAGRNFVVLNSGAVDTLLRKGKPDDLRFLVGHECGHVALGHVNPWSSFFTGLTSLLVYPLYAWYRRCQERSADRCGLYCTGNRADAHRSIATLAGGAEMGSRLSIQAVAEQWSEIRGEVWVTISMFFSEYPHTAERIILVHLAADELRIP